MLSVRHPELRAIGRSGRGSVAAMSGPAVDASLDALFGRSDGLTLAVVVLQGGELVVERYGVQPANPFQPEIEITADSALPSWSMAKSITHAAVGVLVADGSLDLDAPAAVPEWAGTPKAEITVLDLLEMRSGLHFVEDYVDDGISNCIEMLFGDSGPSHAAYAAGQPLDAAPGEVWNYSSGTTNIICRILGDVVTGRQGGTPAQREAAMTDFLSTRLFGPAAMRSALPKFDDAGDFVGSSFVYATARDFARFGELYRNDGVTIGGSRVLPSGWTEHARYHVATDPERGFGYGRHWWTWPELDGSFAAHGYEGQRTLVVPDRELVLVHLGKTPEEGAPALDAMLLDLVRSC